MHPAISREFHFGSLLRFALPTVIMMIFMSMYTIVDGIFVSRFVGTDALSATNIVYPALNLVLAVAIMLSTGGSARSSAAADILKRIIESVPVPLEEA